MGFKADVILWDYANRSLRCRLSLHKVKVESLAFSPNELFLVSLGGQDDGSIVVWNLETAQAVRKSYFSYSMRSLSLIKSVTKLRDSS